MTPEEFELLKEYMNWQPKYAAYNKWDKDKYLNERRKQAIDEMVSEASEVLGVATKAARKEYHIPRDRTLDELGDTFWGLVGVMNEFGFTWKELLEHNMEKLNARNS